LAPVVRYLFWRRDAGRFDRGCERFAVPLEHGLGFSSFVSPPGMMPSLLKRRLIFVSA
jgi:hypothetical protein